MIVDPSAFFIVNPASGNGRVGRDWARISRCIKDNYVGTYDHAMTQYRGHASELARQAAAVGYGLVVVLGGDGTINEVVNGIFPRPQHQSHEVTLGFLPLGKGNDFIRTLGMRGDLTLAVKALNIAETREVDVAKVECKGDVGASVRYFLNVADFGSGGAIAERVNRAKRGMGSQLSYLWAIVATMAFFRNPTITFKIDDGPDQVGVINNFVVANGRFFGGGLKPAPHAQIDDGLLDLVSMGDIGFFEALLNLPRLKRGSHLNHRKAGFYRGRKLVAHSDTPVLVETDGEVVGSLPATFEIVPGALKVKA